MALNKFRKVYASSDSHILPHILLQNHGRLCKSGGMRLCPSYCLLFDVNTNCCALLRFVI